MQITIVKDENDLSCVAARLVSEYVAQNPERALVFPTGNTPLGMFRELVALYRQGQVSFKRSFLVELDEYCGIEMDDRRNLFAWLEREFIRQVDFLPERLLRFNSRPPDLALEALRVEERVAQWGGIGLAVLGLGPNGHIGFNEPASDLTARVLQVNLSPASILSNARYWGNMQDVPVEGFTLGLQILQQAHSAILLVSGEHKAEILKAVLEGPQTSHIPATYLCRMQNIQVLADESAASLLETTPIFQAMMAIVWKNG